MLDPSLLTRIAEALERIAPPAPMPVDLQAADTFVWHTHPPQLHPVHVNRIYLSLLHGIDDARDTLLANTLQFAKGFPANNALLWGARGMGKSSLIKAVHATINQSHPHAVALVEVHREDIHTLPQLMQQLRASTRRFLLFCDDLSFDAEDTTYKSLKAALEGGLEGRPVNVLFYATSNRRHLMPRDMIDNERASAINPGEAVEEKVSLSDRFGLWLGFHACNQSTYLTMVDRYADHFHLTLPSSQLHTEALQWAAARGGRSGRVAWQFITDLAGRLGIALSA